MNRKRRPSDKPYHHGDLLEALIAAAEEIVREGSGAILTLREVARRAGVSHNAPYSHFHSKVTLLAEVAARGFDRLAKDLEPAVAQADGDPKNSLLAVGQAYVEFGVRHEATFRLMFGAELADFGGSDRLRTAAKQAFSGLEVVLAHGARTGIFTASENAALTSWALMHGLTVMILDRRADLPREAEAASHLARDVGSILLTGVQSR